MGKETSRHVLRFLNVFHNSEGEIGVDILETSIKAKDVAVRVLARNRLEGTPNAVEFYAAGVPVMLHDGPLTIEQILAETPLPTDWFDNPVPSDCERVKLTPEGEAAANGEKVDGRKPPEAGARGRVTAIEITASSPEEMAQKINDAINGVLAAAVAAGKGQ